MLVRLIYPTDWSLSFKQIPGFETTSKRVIGKVTFTTDAVNEADLAVIVNFSPYNLKMKAKEVWILHQKPGGTPF